MKMNATYSNFTLQVWAVPMIPLHPSMCLGIKIHAACEEFLSSHHMPL